MCPLGDVHITPLGHYRWASDLNVEPCLVTCERIILCNNRNHANTYDASYPNNYN